ncbi:hypothetical protein ID866_394 [Astraeus odoratus]|nr:hypothetical protein ID866_394 [Astraeus odoratus]
MPPGNNASPCSSTLCFKENCLCVPGYTFEKACPWHDTGSSTLIAEGRNLKDGALVLAKIAPAHSTSSLFLQREAHILNKLSESPEVLSTTLRLIEFLTVPRADGDCVVLLLVHPGPNLLARYFPPSKVNDFLLAEVQGSRPTQEDADVSATEELPPVREGTESTAEQQGDLYDGVVLHHRDLDPNDTEKERYDVMDLASFLECVV